MSPDTAHILTERRDGRLTITMNRAATSNALAPAMVEEMIVALSNLQEIDLVVLNGAGKTFCAGFDLSDLDVLSDGDILFRILRIEVLLQMVHHAPVPVVACAHGHAIGAGADLFTACWHRVAAPGTRFKFPGWNFELALGTRRLTRLLGSDVARDVLIDTSSIDTNKAVEIGLASVAIQAAELDDYLDRHHHRCATLSGFAKAEMLALTAEDTRALDIASIVQTAGRPGLKDRIKNHQSRVVQERAARRAEMAHD